MDLLVKGGFKPGTVIDIGVAAGTPWLYRRFQDAQLVLVDPNPAFAADLARLKRTHDAHVFSNAVGARAGEVVLHLDSVSPRSSSLLAVSSALVDKWGRAGTTRPFSEVRVPMLTLDETLGPSSYRAPFLLKIDTEGYERDVLLGATESLKRTEVVIAEVSVVKRFEGSYEFSELVALMEAQGFRVYDLLYVTTLGRGGPINYMDVAFVRHDSNLLR